MTEVVNFMDVKDAWSWRMRKWDTPDFVYIGRPVKGYRLPASPWANPIRLHSDSTTSRITALEQYYTWITTSEPGKALLLRLDEIRDKKLVCWCAPKQCHGDVLLELLGEKVHVEHPTQAGLDGVQPVRAPLLLWDDGSAGYRVDKDRSNRLFRTSEMIQHPLGIPGKAYMTWEEWDRDYIKETLRVHGCASLSGMTPVEYARYRYEMRLKGLADRDDYRSRMETEILRELLAELKG